MACIFRAAAVTAAVAGCAIGSAPAHAELYKFHLTGRVEYSDRVAFPDVPIGTKVSGSFIYDTKDEPVLEYRGDEYSSATYSYPRRHPFKIRFGDHSIRSLGYVFFDATDGIPGLYPDTFQVATGDTGIKVDGAPCDVSTCYFGLTMGTLPNKSDVLTSIALPSNHEVKKFDGWRYGYVRTHVHNSFTLQFTIDRITSQPCLNGTDPRTACDD